MEKYIEKFIRYLEIEKNYSPHTILNYRLDLVDFFNFIEEKPVEKIDYNDFRRFLAQLRTHQFKPHAGWYGHCGSRLRFSISFCLDPGDAATETSWPAQL